MKRNSLLLLFAAIAFAAAFARHSNVAKSSLQIDSVGDNKFMCIPVESMPMFPGGDIALRAYLRDSVAYPAKAKEEGIMGNVVVGFTVEADGTITEVRVLRSIDPMLDEEALRVVRSMPKWIPGQIVGKATRMKYQVPVKFRL